MAKAMSKQDRELEQYRNLMRPPEKFEDGFTWRTVLGALFLGFIMMPGSMYLALVVGTGGSIAAASQWVTIILFVEIARRSLRDLKMQEVFILYYMAGLAVSSPFQGLLWNQYFVQSDYAHAMGIAQEVPFWWAPQGDVIREAGHTFFTRAWLPPVLMVSTALIIQYIDGYGLGYVLYRITSDVEELPFPMAPVGASGITALIESSESHETWRWSCFSIGGMLGIVFGSVYIALPAITGSFLPKPLMLIPLPFIDLTPATGHILKAVPVNFTFDIGLIITGMVLPFWAVIGGGLGLLGMLIANPLLYRAGILSNWRLGMDVLDTTYINSIDFYLSFGIGLTIAVALISIGQAFRPLLRALRRNRAARELTPAMRKPQGLSGWQKLIRNDVRRGDFSIFIALGIYVFSTTTWISLSTWLIEGYPWKFFIAYAIIYTPLISYACAKLEGTAGQALNIPMIREATYILSGYHGVKIWFSPTPLTNYGPATVSFRVLELTGTKIISAVKTKLICVPIIIVASLLFSQLLWKMADVPSNAYPFAQKMWDLQAKNLCLTMSSTMEGGSLFFEALKLRWFSLGLGFGVIGYTVLSVLGLPTLMLFGMVRGLGQGTPAGITFEVIGALVGRYYFRRKFGAMWMKYAPVLLAGYACGVGLIAMVGMSVAILNKMMAPLVF
ncbi:MAG: peptide transporter [Kiritimatiellae bacterium]|nr:peptide transporter [Kiritimatiellia bacterium]